MKNVGALVVVAVLAIVGYVFWSRRKSPTEAMVSAAAPSPARAAETVAPPMLTGTIVAKATQPLPSVAKAPQPKKGKTSPFARVLGTAKSAAKRVGGTALDAAGRLTSAQIGQVAAGAQYNIGKLG